VPRLTSVWTVKTAHITLGPTFQFKNTTTGRGLQQHQLHWAERLCTKLIQNTIVNYVISCHVQHGNIRLPQLLVLAIKYAGFNMVLLKAVIAKEFNLYIYISENSQFQIPAGQFCLVSRFFYKKIDDSELILDGNYLDWEIHIWQCDPATPRVNYCLLMVQCPSQNPRKNFWWLAKGQGYELWKSHGVN
jgi:hypothetical protein